MVKLEKEARDSYAPRNCLSLFPNNVFPQKKKEARDLYATKDCLSLFLPIKEKVDKQGVAEVFFFL